MEYNIIGSWICSKYKIYVCIKFRCVHFFPRCWSEFLGSIVYDMVSGCRYGFEQSTLGSQSIITWTNRLFFSAAVVDSVFFPRTIVAIAVPLKCNEEDESRICECRMQCKQGTVDMKIRLSTMSEQRALTWPEPFTRSLCSLKCEVQREIYADALYTSTHTHAIVKYTHAFIASIGPFFLWQDEWLRITVIIKYICMCDGPTSHTLHVEKLTRSGLSAKVATLFNFLIWFSNRRVPSYPSLSLSFSFFFSVHRFSTIDFNFINGCVHESYYDIKPCCSNCYCDTSKPLNMLPPLLLLFEKWIVF